MYFVEELIADYRDLEKLNEFTPFSPRDEFKCTPEQYLAVINAKTKITELLMSFDVVGFQDVEPFGAIVYRPDSEAVSE